MNPELMAQFEAEFNSRFGADGWAVKAYLSPAEKKINKPILPETDRSTNRMGAARVWPGPDTPLVEAIFFSGDNNRHTGIFNTVDQAIYWLALQDPFTGDVVYFS